jgi:hypothetical protein
MLEGSLLGPMLWGPLGDRLLVDPSTVVVAPEVRSNSGYAQVNPDVKFSMPTGKRLLGATLAGELTKREVGTGTRLAISFLAKHEESLYHPAGTAVISVGTDAQGTYGVWIADNLGRNVQLLVVGEDAKRIHSLAFSADGGTLYFVAEHGGAATHLHRFDMGRGELATVTEGSTPIDVSVASAVDGHLAWRQGGCGDARTETWFDGSAGPSNYPGMSPVGWLPAARLVLFKAVAGCDGPGDLYVTGSDGGANLLARSVIAPAVRVLRATASPLPDRIQQQAVG